MIKRRDYLFSPNIYWPVKQTLNKSSLDFSAVTNDQRGLHKIADLFSDSLIETRFDHFATLAGSLRKAVSTLLYFAVARKIRQSQHPSALMGWTLPSLNTASKCQSRKAVESPGRIAPPGATEPDVNVSAHPALTVQPPPDTTPANARTDPGRGA